MFTFFGFLLMSNIGHVRAYLSILHQQANAIHQQVQYGGKPKAEDLTAAFKAIHDAIDALADVVERSAR